MAIQAIRYAVSENDDSHDDLLGSVIITMLTTMLADVNLDNARLALTTMIAATNNKPDLILPHLGQLVPLVMRGAVIKPHLIREVEMGPFKHKVDDGLELRKVSLIRVINEAEYTKTDQRRVPTRLSTL